MATELGIKTGNGIGLTALQLNTQMANMCGISTAVGLLKRNGRRLCQYGNCMTEEELFELLSLECSVDIDGTLLYYNALGQWHRVHGPAVEYSDGEHVWCINGKRHRIDGPAVERPDGYCAWWQNGLRHRIDGPAVVCPSGYRAWYQNGQRHRIDGPAIERADGRHEWYFDGKSLTEAEWQQAVASMENA